MASQRRDDAVARLRPWVERARGFFGWTFEDVDPRQVGRDRPWSYADRARELLHEAGTVVDLGTGGGERFSEICAAYGGRAIATEEWHVNAPVAAGRLRPLGIDVVRCSSLALPFTSGSLDLVLDRHEGLEPSEVARVLRPGGTVLTQQVQSRNCQELRRFFPRKTVWPPHFELYQEGFRAAGLEIADAREHDTPVAYRSLGELVYMLCVVSGDIPDFDPLGADLDALLALERELTTPDGIVVTESRCLIEARRR